MSRLRSTLLVCGAAFTLGYAGAVHAQALNAGADLHWNDKSGWVKIAQGWSDHERTKYWSTAQGSLLIPYAWFSSLERADGQGSFASAQNLSSFGFITLDTPITPGGPLAVGLVDETGTRNVRWLGFTCAACHTGAVKVGDKRILIEGGQGMVRFVEFHDALTAALRKTLDDAPSFDRFHKSVNAKTPVQKEDLRSALLAETRERESYVETNTKGQHPGPGRVDALGIIFNSVSFRDLGMPENRFPADAPVSYPALWDTHKFDRVQYNAVVTNTGPGPLVRNVGQVLGVFGKLEFEQGWPIPGYKSTVKLSNLKELEGLVAKLEGPRWPENVLPKIDMAKAEQGKAIFQAECSACHTTSRGNQQNPIEVKLIPVEQVGTDPMTAVNAVKNVVSTGKLEGRPSFVIAGDPLGPTTTPGLMLAHAAIGAVLDHPILALEGQLENMYAKHVQPLPSPTSYKARPLDGVWATAPYLHNGSVRTLYQLLLPAAQRETTFQIGDNDFDPVDVGLSVKADVRPFTFDTSVAGNSAAGHEYGANLNENQKRMLIEFLKTL